MVSPGRRRRLSEHRPKGPKRSTNRLSRHRLGYVDFNSNSNRNDSDVIIDQSTIVVGATSTIVAIIFLLAIGAFIALGVMLHRHPQCLAPEHDQHSSSSSTADGVGWVPVELTETGKSMD